MVEPGQIIVSNNERYKVTEIWPARSSKSIDFVAKRLTQKGVDTKGIPVYAGRGFSYAVKNWELEENDDEQH